MKRIPSLLMASTALMPPGLIAAHVVVGLLVLRPTAALAQCAGPSPIAPSPGSTVTCGSGTFNGMIGTWSGPHQGNIDNVNVNVSPDGAADAVVNGGSESAIIFRDGDRRRSMSALSATRRTPPVRSGS